MALLLPELSDCLDCSSAWNVVSLQLWGSCFHPFPVSPASAWLTEWLVWDWQLEVVKMVVLLFV